MTSDPTPGPVSAGADTRPGRVVIVGAGLAAVQTATALRQRAYAGDIVVLGAERHPPYDRPPLSKTVLLADADTPPPDTSLPFGPADLGIDLRLGVAATGLRDGAVLTDAGEVAYDTLVVATGARPVRLPGTGGHYLRTRDDAFALRAALRPDADVVVCGAGWIGAEVATAARRHGARVTVLEQGPAPVAHALPHDVGNLLARWYAEAGVDLVCAATVAAVEPDGVVLTDGRRLRADVVVVGVGIRAAAEWLADSAVPVDRGVVVGSDLRTGVPGIFAVGDVAARWSERYDARIRGEHWDDAMRAPEVVAAGICGDPQRYDPVPYVWSEQFGRMVQYAGRLGHGVDAIWRGDPERDRAWSACWLDDRDRITAVLTVDRPRDLVQARRLAEAGRPVDRVRLADPAVQVRATAR